VTCGRIPPERVAEIVEGVAEGCREAGCALLGGETAEHPGMMGDDDIDLAGFCVGVCERREMVAGGRVEEGDALIGLASSGPHSNGFSLLRRLLEHAGVGLDERPAELGGRSVADVLLEPTRIYARPVQALAATVDVRAMAHVTGGGIPGNAARMLRPGLGMEIELGSWERPPVFGWIAGLGVAEEELRRVFNLGMGFAAVVPAQAVGSALAALERAGCPAWEAGRVVARAGVTLS
jgi:phosphoribosylformylglycinamidine cyclo-ligase